MTPPGSSRSSSPSDAGGVLFRWRLAIIVAFFAVAVFVAIVMARHPDVAGDATLLQPLTRFVSRPMAFLVTGIVCLIGFLLRAAGEARLGSAVYGQSASKRVVTGGPFRFSRHPLYVGLWLFFAAFCAPYLPPVLDAVLAIVFAFVLARMGAYEESAMQAEHGEAWTAYANAVPRFLGVPKSVPDDGIKPTLNAWLLAILGNLGFLAIAVFRVVVGVGAEFKGLGALTLAALLLWGCVFLGRRLFTR